MDLFDIAVARKLAGGGGGGGGASNIISGEFTAQATEGDQVITIPYEGTGNPIIVRFMAETIPELIADNKGFVIALVGLAKYFDQIPTYAAGYYDKMVLGATCINSSTQYSTPNASNETIYGGTPTKTAANGTVRFASATEIKIHVETSGDGGWYGFRSGTKYYYEVVYSA